MPVITATNRERVGKTRRILLLAGVVLFASSSLFADQNDSKNGIIPGRKDVPYGTYATPLGDEAKKFQDQILELENQAYGLSKIPEKKFLVLAEETYLLENKMIRTYLEICDEPDNQITDFERDFLKYAIIRAYENVRHSSEKLFENMIRYIDHKIPGPNGKQIRIDVTGKHYSVYLPNYRSDQDLTDQQKKDEYKKMVKAFLDKGGSLREIKILDKAFTDTLGSYTRFEYAWMPTGEVRVTEGKAGHVLLAGGNAVRCAGQIIIVKGENQTPDLLIVTNASGNYKPDLLNADQLGIKLGKLLKIKSERIIVTKGEPVSTQAYKIFMKADGVDPKTIADRVSVLESVGSGLRKVRKLLSFKCSQFFTSI